MFLGYLFSKVFDLRSCLVFYLLAKKIFSQDRKTIQNLYNVSLKMSAAAAAKSLQSCPTLCDPIDSSPPGSPVPRILRARPLEWVAFPCPMHESDK